MIKHTQIIEADGTNPYRNLAVEEFLTDNVPAETCILYLWQNAKTVVIGNNQNAWQECKTQALHEDGGHLARRLSGGGAVFHDDGNLNFTFILPRDDFDIARQSEVIMRAVSSFGVCVERSGRNDILANGQKFSGNAFFRRRNSAYHHGTLLINVDMQNLSHYLNVSAAKLESNGVKSVKSRVCN
ncbi:MAG: lipoate--protein ligase, partial [Oscillospiraceae bacterium]